MTELSEQSVSIPGGSNNIFDLPQLLQAVNGGADRYDVTQLYPISGNVNNAYVGQGNASQNTIFQFSDSSAWWSPSLSYFVLNVSAVRFTDTGTIPIPTSDLTCLCDNFPSTLFSQISSQINSRQLDIMNQPWVVDSVLTQANCKRDFNLTFNNMSYVGRGLMSRLNDVAANNGQIEIAWRPPISLFALKCLPPGAMFQFNFNWQPSAAMAFEYLNLIQGYTSNVGTVGTANGNVNLRINSFSFYKANLIASPAIPMPSHGVIELTPSVVNQYFLTGGGSRTQQNITMPATTNRIIVGIQDYNANIVYSDPYATGNTPATQFQYAVSDSTNNRPYNAPLIQAYLALPELGYNLPNPVYSFSPSASGGVGEQDWIRAYSDFVKITMGDATGCESGLPLGTFDPSKTGIMCSIPAGGGGVGSTAAAIATSGDPNNINALIINTNVAPTVVSAVSQLNVTTNQVATTGVPAVVQLPIKLYGAGAAGNGIFGYQQVVSTFNQTARWGYLGKYPLLAFPIVRPENKSVSTGSLNLTFATGVANMAANVVCTYSMALELTHVGNGLYSYNIVEGV